VGERESGEAEKRTRGREDARRKRKKHRTLNIEH